MAKHNVYVNLPWRELGKADAEFEIYQDESKLGTITISKGAIEYYPKNPKQPYKLSLGKFDEMVKLYFEKK